MQQLPRQPSNWPTRVRVGGFLLAVLILVAGATLWVVSSLQSLPALFAALATIFTFLQLIPVVFPHTSPEPAPSSQLASPVGGIHAETIAQTTNVVSGTQSIGTQINYGSSGPSDRGAPSILWIEKQNAPACWLNCNQGVC